MSEPTQDKPEKKKFTERLRDIFRRKAKPAPVPAALYNDKRVQKAVFKARRRRFFKRLLLTSVAAAAAGRKQKGQPRTRSASGAGVTAAPVAGVPTSAGCDGLD